MRRTPTLLAIAFLTGLMWISVNGKSSSACDRERAELECAPGERIAIRGVEYSVRDKWVRPCRYQQGDCRFRVNSDISLLSEHCAGLALCQIKETRLDTSATSPSCPGVTLYRTVHYDCIPDKSIVRICSDAEFLGKTVYLGNTEYPRPIKGVNSDCFCSILSTAGSKLTVNVNELTLSGFQGMKQNEVCEQILNISDTSTSKYFDCSHKDGYYGYREIFNGGPNIGVGFRSDAGESGGRFLLEIKGLGDADVRIECQNEEETPTAVHSHPAAPPTSSGEKNDDLDATAIGLGAAGGVLLIVCVSVVICVVKKRKRGLERKSSDRAMDIRDGVVDPFIVTGETTSVNDNRNGTGTFRQGAQKPSGHEIVYATPGYATPWESHALPSPPEPIPPPLPSAPPLPTAPPLPSSPPVPVSPTSESSYKNNEPTHYTYIAPDILNHVTPKKSDLNENQERPKPAVRQSRFVPSPTLDNHENNLEEGQSVSKNTTSNIPISDADTIFVDNSLYESAGP